VSVTALTGVAVTVVNILGGIIVFGDPLAHSPTGTLAEGVAFALICVAGFRRRKETRSKPAVVLLALGVSATVLGFFAVDTLRNDPETFVAIILVTLLAIVLDYWTQSRNRRGPDAAALLTASSPD